MLPILISILRDYPAYQLLPNNSVKIFANCLKNHCMTCGMYLYEGQNILTFSINDNFVYISVEQEGKTSMTKHYMVIQSEHDRACGHSDLAEFLIELNRLVVK